MDIDKIISIVRSLKEEGGIANVVGAGGLTGSAEPPGRLDGYDKPMLDGRSKVMRRLPPLYRKSLISKKKK